MCQTFTCVLSDNDATFRNLVSGDIAVYTKRSFEVLIGRRQRAKLSTATRIAGGMYKHFDLTALIEAAGGDPQNTPIVVYNRYANWDYVAEIMCDDLRLTLEGVNNYVATAWFPATVQGYLTIEHGNKGEAITIASKDIEMCAAAVDSVFQRDQQGDRSGLVMIGTFESIPKKIGGQPVTDTEHFSFGAFSLVTANDSEDQIMSALSSHQELYSHVTA